MRLNRKLHDCPVCGGVASLWRQKKVDDLAFDIRRCGQCTFAFIDPRPDEVELKAFYSQRGHGNEFSTCEEVIARERLFPNTSLDAARIIGNVARRIDRGELLDVGAGYGFFVRTAKDRGYNVTALELGDFERKCTSEIAGVFPIPVSFEEFDTDRRFDVVIMSQILEHASDVNAWISKALSLLNPGGILAIALPNFNSFWRYVLNEREPYITPPQHLNFFNRRSLTSLLTKHGFGDVVMEDVSRLPLDVLSKRFSNRFVQRIMRGATVGSNLLIRIAADRIQHGMMLNAYAMKQVAG